MAKKPTQIHFVTWPDGKIVEGSQTSVNTDMAINRVILTWLIPEYFPGVELGGQWGGGATRYLWAAMERAGFKVHSIDLDGVDGVSM